MSLRMVKSPIVWVAVGLIAGCALSAVLMPRTIEGVATDRAETFAMATGPLDSDFEAVYMLDFLTGELVGAVVGKNQRAFTARFTANVMADMGIDPSANPKFLMVTGMANIRRGGGQLQPSASLIYVAEITTGRIAAYAIPWAPQLHNAGKPMNSPMVLIAVAPFRMQAGR